jgi:hypothetical protein
LGTIEALHPRKKKKKTRRRGRGRGRRRNKIACVFGLPVEQNCEYSFPCKFDCGMGKIEDISTFEQIEF